MKAPVLAWSVAFLLLQQGAVLAQSVCDAGKLKAYGKGVLCLAKVDAKAAKQGAPVDAVKEQRCIDKFADKCAKAEAKGDCTAAVKSCSELLSEAGTCRSAAQGAGSTTTTTTTPVTTSSTTTTTAPPTFAGYVTNDSDPTMAGAGVPVPWVFDGSLGTLGGDTMCAAIGADHVCTYAETLAADTAGELASVPDGTTFWVHRLTTATVNGSPSPPGAGGRCNDWTTTNDTIADGEYGERQLGTTQYTLDQDTTYTGGPGHAGAGPFDGGPCAGVARAILCCN